MEKEEGLTKAERNRCLEFEVACKFYAENPNEDVESFIYRCIGHYYGCGTRDSRKWTKSEAEEKLKLINKYLPKEYKIIKDKDMANEYHQNYKRKISVARNNAKNKEQLKDGKNLLKIKNESVQKEQYLINLKKFEMSCARMVEENVKTYKETQFISEFRRAYAGCNNKFHWSEEVKRDKLEIFGKFFPQYVDAVVEYAKKEKIMQERKALYRANKAKSEQNCEK